MRTCAATAEQVALQLEEAGFEVLLDDRDERAGVKFKDADLIGIPFRINIGKKCAEGRVELVTRGTASSQDVGIAEIASRAQVNCRYRLRDSVQGDAGVHDLTVKIKVVRATLLEHPVRNIILITLVGTLLLGLVVWESIFGYYYFTYRHIVDERLQKPLLRATAKIYAAPKELRVGQKLTPQAIAQELRNAGYSGDSDHERSRIGTYSLNDASITIQPGPQSSLRTRRHGYLRQRYGQQDFRRWWPVTGRIRTGAGTDHRALRRAEPHQAPPGQL